MTGGNPAAAGGPGARDESFAEDGALAAAIADAAGALLLALQGCALLDGRGIGAVGDRIANELILRALARHRPDDAVLSEEAADDPSRLGRGRVWIVDPLDGTREFGERRRDWAVHVALSVDGRAAAGAVALPGEGITLSTATPPAPAAARADAPPRMVVSRTRPAAEAVAVARALGAVLLPMGSAGAKAMAVVRGEADIYLHTGGQYEWDNCAPVAVARAAGLHASRVDGAPLVYNRPDPSLPDLLICRPELAGPILAMLREAPPRAAG